MSTTLTWFTNTKTEQWTTAEGIPDSSTGGTDTWGTVITVHKATVDSTTNSITLPATMSRAVTTIFEVTEHALETQSQITDHIIRKPNRYNLEAYLANSQDEDEDSVGNAEKTFQQLQQLAIVGTLFTVQNPTFSESDLLIETLRSEKIPNEANLLKITIDFKKIYYVDTLQVELQTAGIRKKTFKAATKESTPEEEEKVYSYVRTKANARAGGSAAWEAKVRRIGMKQ